MASPCALSTLANANPGRFTAVVMAHAHHGNARPLAITRYLQRMLNDWLAANPGVTKKDLADRIDISAAHVTNITKNGRGVGADVEELCAKFLGMTVDELRRKAHEEFRDESPRALELQRADRYPNRARAVEFMREESSDEARSRVLSMELKASEDPPASWWAKEIERAEAMVRMELKRPEEAAARVAAAIAAGDAMEEGTRPKRRQRAG